MGLIRFLKNLHYGISKNETLYYRQEALKRAVEVNFDMMDSTLNNNSLLETQKDAVRKDLFTNAIKRSLKAVDNESYYLTEIRDELDRHDDYSHKRRIFVFEEALRWLTNKEYLEKIDLIKRSNLSRKNKNVLYESIKTGEYNFDDLIGYMDVKTVSILKQEMQEKERLESCEQGEEEQNPNEESSQSFLLADERSEEENQVSENESQESDFEEEEEIETTSIEVVESEEEQEEKIEENGVFEDEEEKEENETQRLKQVANLFSC